MNTHSLKKLIFFCIGLYQCSLSKDTYKETLVHHVEVKNVKKIYLQRIDRDKPKVSGGESWDFSGRTFHIGIGFDFKSDLEHIFFWNSDSGLLI